MTRGLLFALALCWTLASYSQEKERPFFQSSRALGMGDAFTAIGDGFAGPFYNPAGLAHKSEFKTKVFDLEVTGSHDLAIFGQELFGSVAQLSNLLDRIVNERGSNYSAGVSFIPQILVKNFSVGVVGRMFSEGRVQDNSNLQLYSYADLGAYLQTGLALWGGILKLGAGVKILDRAEAVETFTPEQYLGDGLEYGNEWREGLGIGYDAGAILTFPVRFLPRIGLAIQNIGNMRFDNTQLLFSNNQSDQGPPRSVRQRINLGAAFKVKHGRNVKSMFAVEVKDLAQITNSSEVELSDQFHAGWELDVRKVLFLRAGVNQGRYWTGGFGLQVGSVRLDLTSYGENIAFRGDARVDDRKYVGRYSLIF